MSYPKLTPIIAKGASEPRYLEDRFADVVNVKDFGAKGDGATDDTSAFAAAYEASPVYFVPETKHFYKLTTKPSGFPYGKASIKVNGSDFTIPASATNGHQFNQIPVFPQAFKAQATRIKPGVGSLKSITEGSPSSYVDQINPVSTQQLWTNVNIGTLDTNWVANQAVQTTIGPDSKAMVAGVFSEIATYNPGVGEAVGLVGMARALADRSEGSQQFDAWGAWLIGTNNGWQANVCGAEVNATNQYANWLDTYNPAQYYPDHFSIGLQIFNDWSTRHNTRGISIVGKSFSQEDPTNIVGWSTGILVSGYVNTGLYVDSDVSWQDPENKTVSADPVGITFGHLSSRKMAFNLASGDTRFQLNVEGDRLVWRGDYVNWYIGMKDSDKNLYLVNSKFRFDVSGRAMVNGSAVVGNCSGPGLTICGADIVHPLAITRAVEPIVAPGSDIGVLRWESGTAQGTMKLVAYAGTSTVGVTIVDNVGTGSN